MTFEVLPPKTPQERADAAASLAEGVADGNRDAIRAAVIQTDGSSSDAIAIALRALMGGSGGIGLIVQPDPWYTREGARGLPVDEHFIVDDEAS